MKSIAIIGGGASALICAIFASKNNKVSIFCKDEKLGKKILVTGNGRCNLTNLHNFSNAYNTNIDSYLNNFSNEETISFFNKIGLLTYSDEEGRVYPISNSASSVCDVLINKINENKNIIIKCNEEIKDINYNSDKYKLFSNNNEYVFDKIVISTGSEDLLLEKLNVNYEQFKPSLVSLKTKEDTHILQGLRLSNVEVSLDCLGKEYKDYGEVLFKDKGLSGICIFNLSAYMARENSYKSKIKIDLLPKYNNDELLNILTKRLNNKNITAIKFMDGIFNTKINSYILKSCGIKNEDILKLNELNILVKNIKGLTFNIVDFYNNNQVKSGGVLLEDLTKNLEYKKQKGLYFTGEIINVDGICGGYNLQWAWTSGKIVGENI